MGALPAGSYFFRCDVHPAQMTGTLVVKLAVGYRRILAGTDGSETATASVRTAARLAKRFRSELLVVSAYEAPAFTADQAQRALDSGVEAAREEGVEAQTEILLGQIGDVLLDRARRRGVELIVIGNRGIGPAKRIGLGSLADRVAHDAPCDLLIVNTAGPGRRSEELYRSMLVGTDGSATAGEAVRKAYELAMVLRAEVHLVHVGDPLLGAITLEEAEGARSSAGPRCRGTACRAIRRSSLLEVAEQEDVGLILVGNKGMAGAKRLLGSVPNAIAHRAPCDVLIARTVGRSVDDLAPGTGGLVDMAGVRVAAYRDEAGAVHALDPRCTHMGCTVDWNETERTWDCPCHGSRYSVDGEVIEGPAARPLPPAYRPRVPPSRPLLYRCPPLPSDIGSRVHRPRTLHAHVPNLWVDHQATARFCASCGSTTDLSCPACDSAVEDDLAFLPRL